MWNQARESTARCAKHIERSWVDTIIGGLRAVFLISKNGNSHIKKYIHCIKFKPNDVYVFCVENVPRNSYGIIIKLAKVTVESHDSIRENRWTTDKLNQNLIIEELCPLNTIHNCLQSDPFVAAVYWILNYLQCSIHNNNDTMCSGAARAIRTYVLPTTSTTHSV